MKKDIWHYSRAKLAKQILEMFNSGLSNALTFFAPRRMGKTEFLLKDIQPMAEKQSWRVCYFSFLDVEKNVQEAFTLALAQFAENTTVLAKTRKFLQKISKISAEVAGVKAKVELKEKQIQMALKDVFSHLAAQNSILLLLDEVQVLSNDKSNQQFVAALRTALDMYRDKIKVIFTGSSREGLRRMFSQANAPFFHFGQNLPFPELDKNFTDHLTQVFHQVTQRQLDANRMWEIFQEMDKVPQLARSLVERLALNPNLKMDEAKQQLLSDIFSDRAFVQSWDGCSTLEKLLLEEISANSSALFSAETRNKFAKKLGIAELSVPTLQSSLRVLQRKSLIGRLPERGGYFIDDPNFKTWLLHEKLFF